MDAMEAQLERGQRVPAFAEDVREAGLNLWPAVHSGAPDTSGVTYPMRRFEGPTVISCFLAASLAVWAVGFPGHVAAQRSTLTGTLTAVWGDAPGAGGQATLDWILSDDGGDRYHVTIPTNVVSRAGGVSALDRRRVVIGGSLLPSALAQT